MGVGAGLSMYVVVVQKFTFTDEFLYLGLCNCIRLTFVFNYCTNLAFGCKMSMNFFFYPSLSAFKVCYKNALYKSTVNYVVDKVEPFNRL